MNTINQTTVPNLILAATFAPVDNTPFFTLNAPISLPGDFTLYAVADVVAGANWAAFGSTTKSTRIGAKNGVPVFTIGATLTGLFTMTGGQIVSGRALMRVARAGDTYSVRVTGGTTLDSGGPIISAEIDVLAACPKVNMHNSDPSIRHLFNAIIGRAIALDSTEDILIREWIKDTLGATL